jgi:hypothetical protein
MAAGAPRGSRRCRCSNRDGGTRPWLIAVAIARLDLASLRALAYAASFDQPVLAVHISPDDDEARRFRQHWEVWGNHLRAEVIVSPYRAIVGPLANYLEALHALRPGIVITTVPFHLSD